MAYFQWCTFPAPSTQGQAPLPALYSLPSLPGSMRPAAPSLAATGRRTGCSRISRSRAAALACVGPAVEGLSPCLSRPVRKVFDLLVLGLGLGLGLGLRLGLRLRLSELGQG